MKTKKAFTIIEVSLVLGITALAVTVFMVSISGRISSQRYNDATRGYVDFLQKIYTEVINVQNGRTGEIGDESKYCTLSNQDNIIYSSELSEYGNEYPGR